MRKLTTMQVFEKFKNVIITSTLGIMLCASFESTLATQSIKPVNTQEKAVNPVHTQTKKRRIGDIHQHKNLYQGWLDEAIKEWRAPGAVIVVIKGDQTMYISSGYTKVDQTTIKGRKIDENTVFQIASLSKNFLTHLIAKLIAEKQYNLSFDMLLTKLEPKFSLSDKATSDKFTLRDALSHRSGLPGFSADTLWYLGFDKDAILQGLSKIPVVSILGSKYAYQNQIFGVVSQALEKQEDDITIEQLLTQHFLKPLGMTATSSSFEAVYPSFDIKHPIDSFQKIWGDQNFAQPHGHKNGLPNPLPESNLIYTFQGSSGVNTTAVDFAKWMRFLLIAHKNPTAQSLNHNDIYKELRTPQVSCGVQESIQFPKDRFKNLHYGMGFFIAQYGDLSTDLTLSNPDVADILFHMGGFYGCRSYMVVFPKEDFAFAIFSNLGSLRTSMLPEGIAFRIMEHYMNIESKDAKAKNQNGSKYMRNWTKEIRQHTKETYERYLKEMNSHTESDYATKLPLDFYKGSFINDMYGEITIDSDPHSKDGLTFVYNKKKINLKRESASQFRFVATELSHAFGETDIGLIYFGRQADQGKLDRMQNTLLFEGLSSGLFERAQ